MDLYQLGVVRMMLEEQGVLWENEPVTVSGQEYRGWTIRFPDGEEAQYDSPEMATDQYLSRYENKYFCEQAAQLLGPEFPRSKWGGMIDPLNDARRGLAELDLSAMLTTLERDSEAGRAISALGSIARTFARALQESHSPPISDEEIGSRPDLEKRLIDEAGYLGRFVENTLVPWNVGHRRNPRYLQELLGVIHEISRILQFAAHLPQFMPPEPPEE
jgi:hypothetical protein